jgi:predicted nuclease with TOPRIM domain
MWDVAVKIMTERRRREVEPVVKDLKSLAVFEANTFEEKNFKKMLNDTIDLSEKLTSIGTMVEKADKFSFFKWIIKGF